MKRNPTATPPYRDQAGRVPDDARPVELAGELQHRGKNSLDAMAKAYIESHSQEGTVSYAWKIVKHESKPTSGDRHLFYNQFNANTSFAELPNFGAPDGWGIAQIDRSGEEHGDNPPHHASTAEVYDWHANVLAMSEKLQYSLGKARDFVQHYRSAYSGLEMWTEPPTTNINGVVVAAEEWAVMVIYNGVDGIPAQTTPTHNRTFYSPLQFDQVNGQWKFHRNCINPNYVMDVIVDGGVQEIE